jgi:hypothetical protein
MVVAVIGRYHDSGQMSPSWKESLTWVDVSNLDVHMYTTNLDGCLDGHKDYMYLDTIWVFQPMGAIISVDASVSL